MPPTDLRRFFLSIVMPSILAIGLFILSIFVVILPAFERNIMKGKKEMISELTHTVCSLIDEYNMEARANLIPLDSARALAIDRVGKIRYGDQQKDYFWIIDKEPSMIMHPYRPELIGQDLSAYEDSQGKLLFVESLKLVNEKGEGFVDYMWQWKDDSSRIVPKLSYVMEFKPWNWIVGTGIYLEDVRLEIASLKKRLLSLSLLISLLITAILISIIRQSLNIERKRRKAEGALSLSREKYKSLVEASTEGTLMWVEGAFIFSNIKFSRLSAYTPQEIGKMSIEEIFDLDWHSLEAEITDPKMSVSRECTLSCKDGSTKEVVVSASRISHANQVGYIMIVKEVSPIMKYEKESEQLSGALQSSLLMMSRPLSSFATELQRCPSTSSISEAAILLTRKQCELLFIQLEGEIIGLLNHKDLVTRALSTGLKPEEPVIKIMSAPVQSLPGESPVFEGLHMMKRNNISHIALTDHTQKITGSVGYREICGIQKSMLDFLLGDIERSQGVREIQGIYERLPVLISALVESGSTTANLTRIITSVADAIHRRLINLALEELGPPPCAFAFMVMGSQGRGEQSLATDQDNAIVFEDLPGNEEQEVSGYFLQLGKKLNRDLDAVGYKFCPGEIMAGNPKWNQSLETWKTYFNEWIRNSNPVDILDAAIFFDFRCIHGKSELVQSLRDHVNQAAHKRAVFYYHMAQSVLKMKVHGSGSDTNTLDLKILQLPLSSFIRLYAIREKLSECNSIRRAEILREMEVLDEATFDELSFTFNHLTYLRIKGQAGSIARNDPPLNTMEMNRLNRIEAALMKKILSDISGLQTRLSTAFSGPE